MTLPECYNDSPDIIVLVMKATAAKMVRTISLCSSATESRYIGFTGTPLLKDDKTGEQIRKIIHLHHAASGGRQNRHAIVL